MSRGPGRVQVRVLAALDAEDDPDRWWSVEELAQAVFGSTLSRAGVESTRRAVKRLADDGRVAIETFVEFGVGVTSARIDRGDFYAYRPSHSSSRVKLCVHRPMTAEHEAARAQQLDASVERLATLDARTPARNHR